MRYKKVLLMISGILLSLFAFWFFYLRFEREYRLIEEGNVLIERIENFRLIYARLPNSLSEIGIEEQMGIDALYYDKVDSFNYIVYFGMDLGESMVYYSDAKQWLDH